MMVEIENGKIKGFLSVKEASKKFDIKEGTIRQMIHKGQINTLKIGRGTNCLHFIPEEITISKNPIGRPKKVKGMIKE